MCTWVYVCIPSSQVLVSNTILPRKGTGVSWNNDWFQGWHRIRSKMGQESFVMLESKEVLEKNGRI